jgi:hypothetical protein
MSLSQYHECCGQISDHARRWLLVLFAFVTVSTSAQLPTPSLEQIKIAADAGDPAAQDKMAERDTANAEMWYRKAAQQGYVHAQGKLAERLLMRSQSTIGVKPEARAALTDECITWATLAANQGDKQGEATLARIYLEGKLVKQDLVEAYKWGDLSAKNPTPEFIIFYPGASSRDSAILKMNADQIAEARRRVAEFVPHQPAKSELPKPGWIGQIKLQGILGTADHRLASINGKTLGKGDEAKVKINGKSVTIHCLEVRESSASVSIEGIEGVQELKMSDN